MLRKPVHFILYLSTLQKPAAGAGFCNVLKYKADTFYLSTLQEPAAGAGFCNVLKYKADILYLSTIQKPAPDVVLTLVLLNCLFLFFNHLKLELLTQNSPALNDEKYHYF